MIGGLFITNLPNVVSTLGVVRIRLVGVLTDLINAVPELGMIV